MLNLDAWRKDWLESNAVNNATLYTIFEIKLKIFSKRNSNLKNI